MALAIERLAGEQEMLGSVALDMRLDEEQQEMSIKSFEGRMNILDRIIAMIFSRITQYKEEKEHWNQLALMHEKIRGKWEEEFGSLPPNSIWRESIR
jgi:hypothetical protein